MSRVYLAQAQKNQIFAQLEAAYPAEGAGFLLGHLVEGHSAAADVVIDKVIPVENVSQAEERHHRFAVTPQDWARLEDLADESGLTLIGCYHSHPDSPAEPSDYDRTHSLPNFLYIIVSVLAGKADAIRVWELSHSSSHEHIMADVSDRDWQEIMTWDTVR